MEADGFERGRSMKAPGPEPVSDLLVCWKAGGGYCLHQVSPFVAGEIRHKACQDHTRRLWRGAVRMLSLDKGPVGLPEMSVSAPDRDETLGVHPNTVIHDWSLAKAWLKREFERSARDESGTLEENR